MRTRLHYGWVVAGAALVVLVTSAGFRSTATILIKPLEEEFGWSRATISAAFAVNLLFFGLGAPFAAAFMERFGVRRVVCVALAAVALASGLTVFITTPWQLVLLWGVVIGAATGALSVPLAAIVATRWFVEKRGLVTGMLTAANATGQLVFLPLLAWVTTSFGWRFAVLTIVVVALAVVIPVAALFIRDRPADVGLRPYGAVVDDPQPRPSEGAFAGAFRGLGLGLSSGPFWILATTFFICGLSTNGLIATHLVPAAMDHGMTEVAAASLLAAIGVFDIVGTLASGWLTDRYDSRVLLFWYYGLRGLSLIALPIAFDAPRVGLLLFVVFYGLDWVATVPPTVALTIQHFGRENVGLVFGWIFAAHQLGGAVAAIGAGAAHTLLGDYTISFVATGVLCLLAGLLVLRIRPTGSAPRVSARPVPEVGLSP